jgi:hypothetical protein
VEYVIAQQEDAPVPQFRRLLSPHGEMRINVSAALAGERPVPGRKREARGIKLQDFRISHAGFTPRGAQNGKCRTPSQAPGISTARINYFAIPIFTFDCSTKLLV